MTFENIKKFFDRRFIFSIIIAIASVILIIISMRVIKFNNAIHNMLPSSRELERNVKLVEKSPLSDRIVLFVNSNDKDTLESKIESFKKLINESEIEYTNTIPDEKDIREIMDYCQTNSLLLYPYETEKNPFSKENLEKGFEAKKNYVESMPFFSADQPFFLDPLLMGFEILKTVNMSGQNKLNSRYGGIVSDDGKSYILVLKTGIFPDNYEKSEKIVLLDKNIKKLSKELKSDSFILSSHLYYQDSFQSIQIETSIMFLLSTIFTIFIFFFFFRDIKILFYSLLPMLLGISLTFVCIAIFKRDFGGIAFGFGSTILGISSDYTVHYLVKRQHCLNIMETNEKIGKALILGFITTIAPLAILPFSGIVSLQEIAILGILSVGFSFIFTWFLLRRLAPPGEACTMRTYSFKIFGKKGFIAFIVLFTPFIIALFFLQFEDNISKLDKIHPEMERRVAKIKKSFGYTADSTMLCFSGVTKDIALEKSKMALNYLESQSAPLFLSPSLFMPDSNTLSGRKKIIKQSYNSDLFKASLANSIFDGESFRDWENAVKNIDDLNLSKLPKYIAAEIKSMIIEQDGIYYIVIPIQNRDNFSKIDTSLKNGNIDYFTIDLIRDNSPGLLKFEKIAMLILIISLIVIFIILLFAYKNIFYTITSMIPALVGLAACFGISALIGKSINIMHIVASMILIGICVDYGVFVTSAYKDYHGEDGINMTFLSILICALVTLAGFGALMISSNQAMFTLGISVFFGITFSFLSSWLIIPYLMRKR